MKPMSALVIAFPGSDHKRHFFNSTDNPILTHAPDEYLIAIRSMSLPYRLDTSNVWMNYGVDDTRRRYAADADKEIFNLHWIARDIDDDDEV